MADFSGVEVCFELSVRHDIRTDKRQISEVLMGKKTTYLDTPPSHNISLTCVWGLLAAQNPLKSAET